MRTVTLANGQPVFDDLVDFEMEFAFRHKMAAAKLTLYTKTTLQPKPSYSSSVRYAA